MSPEITFWNPYSSAYEVEQVYGEKWLRFSYENLLGSVGMWAMVQRKWFSDWYGKQMDLPKSKSKILPFITKYGLKEEEFLNHPESFGTFNEFFYRKLKPSSRPIDSAPDGLIFPADGRHLLLPDVSKVSSIYAKGQSFDLMSLLGCKELAGLYSNGSILISRLCPVDYHRFHFPVDGELSKTNLINGSLFSVSPIALRQKISIFWENKRYLSTLVHPRIGKISQLLIGATCVGSVHLTNDGPSMVKKGDEYGYFSFGGSCVMTIFPSKKVAFRSELIKQSSQGFESYFKFGDHLGKIAD